jgi:hypothetical protein
MCDIVGRNGVVYCADQMSWWKRCPIRSGRYDKIDVIEVKHER